MFYTSKINLGRQVSLVICPMDDFTGAPVKDESVRISVVDQIFQPVYRPDGFIVFTGMSAGKYIIRFRSNQYFNQEIAVDFEPLDIPPVLYISMKPLPAYSFYHGNLIRLLVTDRNNKPLAGAQVKVSIRSPKCYKAKLGRQGVDSGDNQFVAYNLTGFIAEADCFYITNLDDQNQYEEFTIASKLPEDKGYKIKGQFQNRYDRGTPIWPLLETCTDYRGEAVVYLRQMPISKVEVAITITYQDCQHTAEACFAEGTALNLGRLKLDVTT